MKKPTESPPRATVNRQAYDIAKATTGRRYDLDVAEALGVHPVTWTRILNGQYPLTPRVQALIRGVFPDQADAIIVQAEAQP
jgi:DNA-directed RNA polymerase specialized sigma54-like protein